MSCSAMVWGICSAGIVQIFTHLHYFMHLDTSSAARWNVIYGYYLVRLRNLFRRYGNTGMRLFRGDATLERAIKRQKTRDALVDWLGSGD